MSISKITLALTSILIATPILHVESQPANDFFSSFGLKKNQCSTMLDVDGTCIGDNTIIEDWMKATTATTPYLEDDEVDPMLAVMPTVPNFKAYRRADISSFYQEPPGSRLEKSPSFKGQAGKFVNMSPFPLQLRWDPGAGPPGTLISNCGPFESTGTSTFPGHVFHFVRPSTQEVICTFNMVTGVSVYYCNPFELYNDGDPSSGKLLLTDLLPMDSLLPKELKLFNSAAYNREFAALYKNFTGGSEWLGNYPPQPPQHHMWRADYFGQTHHVLTEETQFFALPPPEELQPLNVHNMKRNRTDPLPYSEYRESGLMNVTIKAISCAPRIFQIDGFLSEAEINQ